MTEKKTAFEVSYSYSIKNEGYCTEISVNKEIQEKLVELLRNKENERISETWLDENKAGHKFYAGGFDMTKFSNQTVGGSIRDDYGSSSIHYNIGALRTKELLATGKTKIFYVDSHSKIELEGQAEKISQFLTELYKIIKGYKRVIKGVEE